MQRPDVVIATVEHELDPVGQITYSPLGQGVLTGKYPPAQAAPRGSRAAMRILTGSIARYFSPELRERVELLRPIAESSGLSLAQLAIAWVLRNRYVAAAIIGASRPEQISENVKAVGTQIDDEVMVEIDTVLGDIVDRDPAKAGKPYDVMARWQAPESQ